MVPPPVSAVPSRSSFAWGSEAPLRRNWRPPIQIRRRSGHYLIAAVPFRPAPHPIEETMNQPAPALPISRSDTRGHACIHSLMGIKRRTGVTMPKHLLLKMAFDSGYEAGAQDAGSGELLAEAKALQ